jgi:ParB family chromosome partitioning protein
MAQRRTRIAELGKAAKATAAERGISPPPSSRFEGRMASLDSMISSDAREVSQILVDPKRCRMWRRHNRLYDKLTAQNCSDLIERIGAEGQKVPALVRRLPEGDTHDFEVIAGARRHFAVSYLRDERDRDDVYYLVEPQAIDDRDAFVLSDLENRSRKDISDYERALDYKSALDEFYSSNVSRMAEEIGMNRSSLKHYIALASLPMAVVDAYGELHELPLRHGSTLLPKLKREGEAAKILDEAASLSGEQRRSMEARGKLALSGSEVLKRLTAAAEDSEPASSPSAEETVTDDHGAPIVIAQRGRKYLSLKVPTDKLDDKKAVLAALRKLL